MAGTLTATPDPGRQRVAVELGGWVAPSDGPLTVYRVHPGGTQYPVRGLSATSGGAAFAYDYETPFGTPVTYTALDGTTTVTSTSATLTVPLQLTGGWLSVPGLPSYGQPITPTGKPETLRARPQAVIVPWGRATPIVLSDTRKSLTFAVNVRTHTDAEAVALTAMLDASDVLLMRLPATRTGWQYVAVGDVRESPDIPTAAADRIPGDVDEWSVWTLPCTVVDSPVGGIFGDPNASYQVILDTYPTYTALLAGKATYLDVLKGV